MNVIVYGTTKGQLVVTDPCLIEIQRPPTIGANIAKAVGVVFGFLAGGAFGAAFISATTEEDNGLRESVLNLKPTEVPPPADLNTLDRIATCSGDAVPEQLSRHTSLPRGLEEEAELTFFPRRRVRFIRLSSGGAFFANVDGTKNLEVRLRFWQVGAARTQLIRLRYPLR